MLYLSQTRDFFNPNCKRHRGLLKIAFSNYAPVVILTAGNFSN